MTNSILEILNQHRGARNAITSARILAELRQRGIVTTDVELRQTIRLLTISGRQLICSSCHKPVGFFIPITDEEIEMYARQLKSRIREIAIRLHAIEKEKVRAQRILKELNLPFDDDDNEAARLPQTASGSSRASIDDETRTKLDEFYAKT